MRNILKNLAIVENTDARSLFLNIVKVNFIYSPLVLFLFVVGFGGFHNFWNRYLGMWIISFFPGIFCTLGSKIVEVGRAKILHFLGKPIPETTVLFGFSSALPFMLPGMYVGFAVSQFVMSKISKRPWAGAGTDLSDYSAGLMAGTLSAALFLIVEMLREQKQSNLDYKNQLRELDNEKLKAEVAALSAQLNPHFLFNSLNTIAAAIPSNPLGAEDMVVRLADLYRSILKAAKRELHTLAEELTICRSYLDIEATRFGERVKFTIHVADNVIAEEIEIPVLTIQTLIENSVKHGLAPKKDGGTIYVAARYDYDSLILEVTDTGLGSGRTQISGEGTGLKNCSSRLDLIYGPSAQLKFDLRTDGATSLIVIPKSRNRILKEIRKLT